MNDNNSSTNGPSLDRPELSQQSRRQVLQRGGGLGLGILLGSGSASAMVRSDPDTDATETVLGEFEDGLDGWKTSGGNRLDRVSRAEEPAVVTHGDHALAVTVRGDPHPAIWNRERFADADIAETPYLVVDVLPEAVEDTDSDVTFQFRIVRGNADPLAVSPEYTIEQQYGGALAWDLRDIDSKALTPGHTLELAWHLADHPPSERSRGRGQGTPYRGTVYVDGVRLTDDVDLLWRREWIWKRRELQREFGFRVDTTVKRETDESIKGRHHYEDGSSVPFEITIVEDRTVEMEIDDETFRFRGLDR